MTMGTVLKKTFTKPLPVGAELFTREGKQFARWKNAKGKARKATVTVPKKGKYAGQTRIIIEGDTYFAKYRDGSGIVRTVPTGCRDETAARSILADLERRAELVKANVITVNEDQIADHQIIVLNKHFDAYENFLKSKGVTKVHRENTRRFLDRLATECAFRRLIDLKREAMEKWLAQMSSDYMSARSRNGYQGAMVSFCNWCVENKRLAVNPFEGMLKANEKADRRRQRRSMTEPELLKLLDVARRRPLLDAQTVRRGERKGEAYAKLREATKQTLDRLGRERALVYKALILTGLRKGELASLSVGQLHVDGRIPYVDLYAADEKNRQGSEIILRDDLADDLRHWIAEKLECLQAEAREKGEPIPVRLPMELPLFTVPAGLLRILNRDLDMAGIPKKDERGRTLVSKGGVAPRTAQAAMRHADIRMTMQTYTDPKLLDVRTALDVLPTLPLGAGQASIGAILNAMGADDLRQSPLAPTLAPTPYKLGQRQTTTVKTAGAKRDGREGESIDATADGDKRKDPLTTAVNGSGMSGRLDSNQRPLEPHSSALAKLRHAPRC
jgi:integrase